MTTPSTMEAKVETRIDGKPFAWRAAGEFAWGEGPALCQLDRDPLLPGLGADGYRVLDLPAGCAERIADGVATLLGFGLRDRLPSYHLTTDEALHLETIDKSRELRFADLDIRSRDLTELFGRILGLRLSETVAMLGRDHVQLRINRPGSTDYNPPHRDGSLPIWTNVLNVWIPIAGVDGLTSLPIMPGSHRIAEEECWQTKSGGAAIGGRRYRVPAITRLRNGPLNMRRSTVRFGQALLFTPFLIHGLAVNQGHQTRMALELRLNTVP